MDQKSLLRKYERELKRLRQELDERTKNLVDKRALLQLDEQRRKAEADKLRAITELEQRSQEFLKEKKEKMDLEERINAMQSQMLVGGRDGAQRPEVGLVVEPRETQRNCLSARGDNFFQNSQVSSFCISSSPGDARMARSTLHTVGGGSMAIF